MTTYTFEPPTDKVPFMPPLERWHTSRGRTVYRTGGVWHETADPYWPDLAAADAVAAVDQPGGEKVDGLTDHYVFIGGHVYVVSQAVRDALVAAGYTLT